MLCYNNIDFEVTMSMMTKEVLLAAPEDDYMNDDQQAFFRQLLIDLREETLESMEKARKQLSTPPEMNDEGDHAAYEEESRLSLRILDRERRLLPKIEDALKRLAAGEYGYCLESGEPIGIPRLLARPTAELCAEVKALNERREQNYRH
jgi:DnaK suppressor protein|tara:strand:- start:99 stop:545 length:447 start_codon:yes stop_codon:yes gene_type:complete